MESTEPIYLDHAATTPLSTTAQQAMLPYLDHDYGNPSSVHAAGRAARNAVDAGRDRLASVLDCAHREIVFTSSGTESDNLALRGLIARWGGERGRHLVVSAVEHDAVLETARSLEASGAASLTVVGCDSGGRVDPEAVADAVHDGTLAVSVMFVNNETGVIQDVAAIVSAVRRKNKRTLVHSDAVQALGRLQVRPAEMGVDLLSLSAHKVYGPKGIGALWVRDGVVLAPLLTGGGQERNRRSGTENVAGVVGFATAVALAERRRGEEMLRQTDVCRVLTERVCGEVAGTVVTGDSQHRAAGFATFAFPGVRTDLLLTVLDGLGVYASGGSACSSGAPTPSHVLRAMGFDIELAAGALRCSTGEGTTEAEATRAASAIVRAVRHLRGD